MVFGNSEISQFEIILLCITVIEILTRIFITSKLFFSNHDLMFTLVQIIMMVLGAISPIPIVALIFKSRGAIRIFSLTYESKITI